MTLELTAILIAGIVISVIMTWLVSSQINHRRMRDQIDTSRAAAQQDITGLQVNNASLSERVQAREARILELEAEVSRLNLTL
ncbi:MAG: hypothetical protein HOE54_16405, partial [Gammaproteobacteria bacterium]|nr:hypothetical protein [Gammaproteobacteria bacterium]